jgi:hypothetical protein
VDGRNDALNDRRIVQEMLAEPFPWTVSQGVILILVIVNNQLKKSDMDYIHANHPVRTMVGSIPTLTDIRIGQYVMRN